MESQQSVMRTAFCNTLPKDRVLAKQRLGDTQTLNEYPDKFRVGTKIITPCRHYWKNGTCPYGDNCHYAHQPICTKYPECPHQKCFFRHVNMHSSDLSNNTNNIDEHVEEEEDMEEYNVSEQKGISQQYTIQQKYVARSKWVREAAEKQATQPLKILQVTNVDPDGTIHVHEKVEEQNGQKCLQNIQKDSLPSIALKRLLEISETKVKIILKRIPILGLFLGLEEKDIDTTIWGKTYETKQGSPYKCDIDVFLKTNFCEVALSECNNALIPPVNTKNNMCTVCESADFHFSTTYAPIVQTMCRYLKSLYEKTGDEESILDELAEKLESETEQELRANRCWRDLSQEARNARQFAALKLAEEERQRVRLLEEQLEEQKKEIESKNELIASLYALLAEAGISAK